MKWISKEVNPFDAEVERWIAEGTPFTPPSEELKQCIREGEITALYGLLGDEWEEAQRTLIREYWKKCPSK